MFAIALPMVVSQSCDTVMMFTDRLFLSRLSPLHMSSAMSGGLTSFMLTTFFFGLTGYTTALVAQYYGSCQREKCTIAANQAVLISILSYPFMLSLVPVGMWLFKISGQSHEQIATAGSYFKILMYGSVLSVLRNSLNCFFSGIGKTRVVMVSSIVTMCVNVAANYVLIFGKAGFPALGIEGAAIGTVFSNFCGFTVILSAYIIFGFSHIEFAFKKSLHFSRKVMFKLFRFGYPGGIEFFLNLLAFDLLVLMFQSYGTAVAASVTIAFNWDMVSFVPLIGINIGVTSLAGRFTGSMEPELVKRSAYSGLKLTVIYGSLIILLYSFLPKLFVSVFLANSADSADIFPLAVFMLRMVAIYVIADGCNLVFSGALRGAGDTFWTMIISVFFHWLLVAETFVLVKIIKINPEITWTAFVFTIPMVATAFFIRFKTEKWKDIKVMEADNKCD